MSVIIFIFQLFSDIFISNFALDANSFADARFVCRSNNMIIQAYSWIIILHGQREPHCSLSFLRLSRFTAARYARTDRSEFTCICCCWWCYCHCCCECDDDPLLDCFASLRPTPAVRRVCTRSLIQKKTREYIRSVHRNKGSLLDPLWRSVRPLWSVYIQLCTILRDSYQATHQ